MPKKISRKKSSKKKSRKVKPLRSKKRSTKKRKVSQISKRINWKLVILSLFGIGIIYTIYLDFVILSQFEGKKWALPAQVYARPLELYSGLSISQKRFDEELRLLGYRYSYKADNPGTYSVTGRDYQIVTRPFNFWDGFSESNVISLSIADGMIDELHNVNTNDEVSLFRLEPPVIGRIYPAHREDRVLVKLQQVPVSLIKGLIVVEDRSFYSHHGVNPKAIARALLANIKAGATVKGGSTLTQQLVKNFFLTNKRSLWRKANEAVMSVLLEWHYDKQEILEAYLNEIYLGQDGDRAIHGFGLASRFYFDKPIEQLNLSQVATLLALVRGPSYYDPRRNAKRLLKRRNLVLDLMYEHGLINKNTLRKAKASPLTVVRSPSVKTSSHPAYMDLVKRQLRKDYKHEDLTSEGLQIFTTFDPHIQKKAEQTLESRVKQLDNARGLKGKLQGAVIITNSVNGEIIAMVGDRNPRFAGFNRALDASRQVGSLIKPAVYLTALQQPGKYNLTSLVQDTPITLKGPDGNTWSPRNYDGVSHHDVPMVQALVHSYNQATVRLGLELGFESIADTLHRLGVEKDIPPYPSMLLGSIGLTPFEVTQMYQSMASGGFYTPLKVVREVLTVEGKPLQRFPVNVHQAVKPEYVQILNSALKQVLKSGTAKSVYPELPENITFAGKTGTTNDLKDSWFAGYSGDLLTVVWMGADDNSTIKLSGSSGALRVWTDIMKSATQRSILPEPTEEIEFAWVDEYQGKLSAEHCAGAMYLAFIKGTAPTEQGDCSSDESSDKLEESGSWFKRLFN
jgi:penicillin-binding protein 1B